MTRVDELEAEIQMLDRADRAALREWFREYHSDEWDREIDEGVQTGKLDVLAEQAIAAHESGKTKEL